MDCAQPNRIIAMDSSSDAWGGRERVAAAAAAAAAAVKRRLQRLARQSVL